MKFLPRRLIFTGLIVLGFATIIATPAASLKGTTPAALLGGDITSIQVYAVGQEAPDSNWGLARAGAEQTETLNAELLSTLPPPEQDACLHCHIEGEIDNEWSPISRWFVFGAMGLTFIFGITRNFMVWRTRERWHDRWINQLSKVAFFFFILQATTGILLLTLRLSTTESIVQVAAVIKAIHWGSGLVLFTAALALSFAGALLPWYQRAFWGMIFITEIVGSTFAIANLSFIFLYSEWHDPPAPGRLYGFHMLLIPVAIAGMMSIYFVMQRKRGEIQ